MADREDLNTPAGGDYEEIEVSSGVWMLQAKRCTKKGRTGKPWFTDPVNGLEYPQEEGTKIDGIWYCETTARDVKAEGENGR